MSARDPRLLGAADRIGARLCRDAVWAGARCNWLGWALEPLGRSYTAVYRAQTGSIYDGTAGIALFLARLSAFTGDPIQRATAIGALNQARSAAAEVPESMAAGLYSGAAGIAYATIEIGTLFGDSRLSVDGLRDLERAVSQVEASGWLDVLGGAAGTIQVLLAIDAPARRDALVAVAAVYGRRLLDAATHSDRGCSWDTLPGQTRHHLVGYGHGAGGIACALLELWAATGDDGYRDAALDAFRYERSFFDATQCNWPDLRASAVGPNGEAVFSAAWCHGGPGIGLSRVRAAELLDDPDVNSDLVAALHLTSHLAATGAPAVGGLCLCHGAGGNFDLLIEAASALERTDLGELAEQAAIQAVATYAPNDLPWPCGVNGGGETPNLMLGLAGIGHFFLRAYDPSRVRSVLLVAPAVRARRADDQKPAIASAAPAFADAGAAAS